jgi:hypothetical protein
MIAVQFSDEISKPHVFGDDHAIRPGCCIRIGSDDSACFSFDESQLLSGIDTCRLQGIIGTDFNCAFINCHQGGIGLLAHQELCAQGAYAALGGLYTERTRRAHIFVTGSNQYFTFEQLGDALFTIEMDIYSAISIEL